MESSARFSGERKRRASQVEARVPATARERIGRTARPKTGSKETLLRWLPNKEQRAKKLKKAGNREAVEPMFCSRSEASSCLTHPVGNPRSSLCTTASHHPLARRHES